MTRRAIPAVHRFTADPEVAAFQRVLGRAAVRTVVQSVLGSARARPLPVAEFGALRRDVLAALDRAATHGLLPVINGTGVLLHTNLGRAPLAASALDAVRQLGAGYTNLEYDLAAGERGSRDDRVGAQLRELTGAEAALVVNNCAAAVLLVLDTFARSKEVVVSRGQLIEIGGAFRLPDVLRKSGATLVEVGTTNRTYGRDYRDAWTPNTALFMRTHPSNYRIEGFAADVDAPALAAIAKELGVLSFEDLGSGALVDLTRFGLPHEPTVAQVVEAGIDLVSVSGDKLLGGPQCGIIAGKASLVARVAANPIARALRVDKLTLSALSATLALYLEPGRLTDIPFFAMLALRPEALLRRAEAICARVSRGAATRAPRVKPRHMSSTTGGGTLPLAAIPSAGIALDPVDCDADALAARLRDGRPPVIARVDADEVFIDLRTVPESEDDTLVAALRRAAAAH